MSLLDEMLEGEENKDIQLNERPYSRSREGIDNLKGNIKGYFGGGQIEQGAAETGRMANKLWNEFRKAVGRKYGSSQQTVTFNDVKTFFTNNELDTSILGTNQKLTFTPKEVGQLLLQAARRYNSDLGFEEPKKAPQQTQQTQQEPLEKQPENIEAEKEVTPQDSEPEKKEISNSDKEEALSSLKGQISSLSDEDRKKLFAILTS